MTSGGTCTYTHDVSADRFDDIDGDTWVCPHDAAAGTEHCVFHGTGGAVDDATAVERLVTTVRDEAGAFRCIGARFETLDLEYAILDGPTNHPVDLREATVTESFTATDATVGQRLLLQGLEVAGTLDWENATFERRVDMGGARIGGLANFRIADFRSWLDWRAITFEGPVYARVAQFQDGIYGVDAVFLDAADFLNSRFDDVANFYRARFAAGVVFDSATFLGNAQFIEADIEAPLVGMESATGNPRARDRSDDDTAMRLHGVDCRRDFRLREATVGGDVVFTGATLGRDLVCEGLSVSADATTPVTVDCTETSVVTGSVVGADGRIRYDMTDAVVGEVDVVDSGTFDVFRFHSTTFDGFNFGAHLDRLTNSGWTLQPATALETPAEGENLYLRAKNGAKQVGENRAAAEFFIREMRYRRAGHRRQATSGETVRDRLRGAGGYLANAALDLTCGFGERPWRTVAAAGIIVGLFSFVYTALGVALPYDGRLGYLTFSIEGFVALLIGKPTSTDSVVSLLVAIEGFVGAFMIALFVFTLTRSINR